MPTSPHRSPDAETGSMTGLDLLRPGAAVTQTNCDREPIHVTGAIQPHGLLLVLDPETAVIRQVSANAGAFLGVSADEVLGRALTEWLSEEVLDELKAIARGSEEGQVKLPILVELGGAYVDAVAHENPAGLLVEVEPSPVEDAPRWYGENRSVRNAIASLDRAKSVEDLCAVFATQARRLLGIDRVMVYQFDADWHGEVVAEDHAEHVKDSFFGLHFPATDIPVPARRLFLRNRVRVIADVGYRPSPLVPERNPDTGAALDLSDAVLRSVSPIHVEYLQNMGVAASMSVSIVQDGKLWGLLACHHYEPLVVPYRLRTAADLLCQVFAMQLALKRSETELRLEAHAKTVQARLVEQMTHAEDMIDGLTAETPAVLDLLDVQGSAVYLGGEVRLLGQTPRRDEVAALMEWIRVEGVGQEMWCTDRLPEVYPDGEDFAETAAGVLAVPFAEGWQSAALWFRPEQAQTVEWGGAPKEPEGVTADGLLVLKPRSSFSKWTQEVDGRSDPWTEGEQAAAAELRRAVLRVVLARSEEMSRLNTELERSNAELDAFTYIASHDLKEPLRGINNYAQFLIEDYANQLDEEGVGRLEVITKLTRRLDGFIDALLSFSKVGQAELVRQPVDLGRALDEVKEALRFRLEEGGVALRVPRPLPTVDADPVRVVDILINLVTNAVKYARPDAEGGPFVEIGYSEGDEISAAHRERIGEAEHLFWVRDNGIGIREKHLEFVFGLFKRLHARDSQGGGSGAGLTIVRKIVDRHDGTVWAESAYGEGTTFYFTLSD